MISEMNLQQAAKIVVQERKMLLLSYGKLMRFDSAGTSVDDVERNVYLESFMLHYRNILDFWLYLHIPLSIVMVVLIVAHLLGVLLWGGGIRFR